MLNTHLNSIHRFIISGLVGAGVHFSILIFCKEVLNFSILISTTVAFIIASVVSFSLQKLWAFKNYEKGNALPRQALSYLLVAIVNTMINGLLMHLLVNTIGTYYIISQIITSSLIAVESYIFYKLVVFQTHSNKS